MFEKKGFEQLKVHMEDMLGKMGKTGFGGISQDQMANIQDHYNNIASML